MEPGFATIATIVILAVIYLVLKGQSTVLSVPPYVSAYVFRKGKRVMILEAGSYRFWRGGYNWQFVDPRPFWVHVQGQELTTSDGAPIRVSVSLFLEVVNVEALAQAAHIQGDVYAYVQLKLRDQIVDRSMDQVIEDRDAINSELQKSMADLLAQWGLQISMLAIRDITLLGDTKRAYAEVVNAQLRAKAALEKARGEAAAMRSMLNTAELVKNHPELIHLRALQGMESGQATVEIRLNEPAKG